MSEPLTPADLRKNEQAVKLLLTLGGGALAGGVAARSLWGLRKLMRGPSIPRQRIGSPLSRPIHVLGRIPPQPTDDEAAGLYKTAAAPSLLRHLRDSIARNVAPYLPKPVTAQPLGNAWAMPAATAIAGGGLFTGWKTVDYLLQKERQMRDAGELAKARRDYDTARADEYAAAMRGKTAAAASLQTAFDRWEASATTSADAAGTQTQTSEKQAEPKPSDAYTWLYGVPANYMGIGGTPREGWEKLKGLAYTAALVTGVGSGVMSYNWAKQYDKRRMLQRAMAMRAQRMQSNRPPSLTAVVDDESPATAAGR